MPAYPALLFVLDGGVVFVVSPKVFPRYDHGLGLSADGSGLVVASQRSLHLAEGQGSAITSLIIDRIYDLERSVRDIAEGVGAFKFFVPRGSEYKGTCNVAVLLLSRYLFYPGIAGSERIQCTFRGLIHGVLIDPMHPGIVLPYSGAYSVEIVV